LSRRRGARTRAPPRASPPAARYFPDAAPPKDAWGNEFVYLSNGERYELISLGADGEPGGEDLDADIKSSELWRL
jgi:general secretion pathway protein G